MSTYADTSFLVSLYIFDANSARAASNLQEVPRPVFLTPLHQIEVANACYLRVFRKESTEAKVKVALGLFARDVSAGVYELRAFSADIFQQGSLIAGRQTAKFGTRTLDLLHLASAVFLKVGVFCTFDKNQAKLARAEGLIVRGA